MLSVALSFVVYQTASKPFIATLDDPLALPRELTDLSERVDIPMPETMTATTITGANATVASAQTVASSAQAQSANKLASNSTPSVPPATTATAAQSGPAITSTVVPKQSAQSTAAPSRTQQNIPSPTATAAPTVPPTTTPVVYAPEGYQPFGDGK